MIVSCIIFSISACPLCAPKNTFLPDHSEFIDSSCGDTAASGCELQCKAQGISDRANFTAITGATYYRMKCDQNTWKYMINETPTYKLKSDFGEFLTSIFCVQLVVFCSGANSPIFPTFISC
jgi:hypothetical protein